MDIDCLKGNLKEMPKQGSFRAHCDMDTGHWRIRSFRWNGQDLLEISVNPESEPPVKWTKLSPDEIAQITSKENVTYSLHS